MECPICRSEYKERFQAQHVTALKCANTVCGHIYAENPQNAQGVVGFSDPDALYKKYARRNEDLIHFWKRHKFIKDGYRILDIGAGSGHVLKSLSAAYRHATITCVEPNDESSEYLKGAGYHVVDSVSDLDQKYDAVLLIEVLEHVVKPVELLIDVKKVIEREGKIFLTTPCGALKRGNRPTNAYDNAAHIHFFTETSLKRCVRRAGYSGIDLMTINALKSKLDKPPLRYIKDVARPLMNNLFGYSHLTGFIARTSR